jgi:hypothetical protein
MRSVGEKQDPAGQKRDEEEARWNLGRKHLYTPWPFYYISGPVAGTLTKVFGHHAGGPHPSDLKSGPDQFISVRHAFYLVGRILL